jgi:6-phosphogluconolactonase
MIKVYKNTNEIADALAEMLFELMGNPGTEPIHIALSGGNTPKLIFKYLNENYGIRLADRRFHFWWGDERCVPPTNDDSNYKWAYEYWLKPIGIAGENIHRVIGENDPELEAIRYSEEMKKWIRTKNGFPVIDLNLLGLGEDGHAASIFPHNIELLYSEKWCEVATHPTSGQKRITLTGKVLNNSETVVFISTGAGKAQMVKNVAAEAKPEFPASQIKSVSGKTIWLLDKKAAIFL